MGQAKQRGSFEQRRASAIVRMEAEATVEKARRAELRRKEWEAETTLPLDLRVRRREARLHIRAKLGILVGIAASLSIAGNTYE